MHSTSCHTCTRAPQNCLEHGFQALCLHSQFHNSTTLSVPSMANYEAMCSNSNGRSSHLHPCMWSMRASAAVSKSMSGQSLSRASDLRTLCRPLPDVMTPARFRLSCTLFKPCLIDSKAPGREIGHGRSIGLILNPCISLSCQPGHLRAHHMSIQCRIYHACTSFDVAAHRMY
jgi:hypothetical protein